MAASRFSVQPSRRASSRTTTALAAAFTSMTLIVPDSTAAAARPRSSLSPSPLPHRLENFFDTPPCVHPRISLEPEQGRPLEPDLTPDFPLDRDAPLFQSLDHVVVVRPAASGVKDN